MLICVAGFVAAANVVTGSAGDWLMRGDGVDSSERGCGNGDRVQAGSLLPAGFDSTLRPTSLSRSKV